MDVPILLVIASLIGAGLNVVRGWSGNDKPVNPKKIAGSLITAVIATLATVVVFDASNIGGPVQTVILGLLVGFSSDYTISKLKK